MDITIDQKYNNQRVDKFLVSQLHEMGFKQATRNMIKDYISKGIKVNDEEGKASHKLKIGDTISIDNEYWKEFFTNIDLSDQILPQEGKLDILFEDDSLLVIFKPKGLVVHPGVGNKKNTLANYLRYYLESKNEFDNNMDRAGIVHRLDKGVSGIMVIAKTKEVQEALKKQFINREVDKIYLAQVKKFKESELDHINKENLDTILKEVEKRGVNYDNWFKAEGFIGRDNVNRYKMKFKLYEFEGSKPAKSYILPVEDNKLMIKIVTGRMHQIRATLNYYGYTIKGDTLYKSNREKTSSENIMLQSIYLSFLHPRTKKRMSFLKV
ncbi:MAG: RluA family pseudouridine synthase [Candidatus Dojkabacteria bacterium]|nr:RluA family pseudouridine synthase [Candidatus Dojkabacteria bacterium]